MSHADLHRNIKANRKTKAMIFNFNFHININLSSSTIDKFQGLKKSVTNPRKCYTFATKSIHFELIL